MKNDPLADPEVLIRRIYSYAAYIVGDGPDAEDVTSEAFERMLRYRESFDPAKGTPVAWALGIVRRCIAARAGEPVHLTEEALEALPTPADGLDAADRLTVQAAVSRLSLRERELVALRYGADLTARQIADLLGLRTNAVEVALHRALGRLRADLEDDRPQPAPLDRAGRGAAPDPL